MNISKQYPLSERTKTVILRRCWSVIFDVNGNAPGNATVASFATKALAKQAHSLWAGLKDENRNFAIVVGGKKHSEPPTFAVDGYNWDTYYGIEEDWREDKDILTSLAQLTTICSCEEATDLPDGVVFEEGEAEGDDQDVDE